MVRPILAHNPPREAHSAGGDTEEHSSPLHARPGPMSVDSSDPLNLRSEDGAWRESSSPIFVRDSDSPPSRYQRFPRERSRKGDPVVQISLMPLNKLKRFYHPRTLPPPTESSRRRLLRQQGEEQGSSRPSRMALSRSVSATKGSAWRNGSLSLSVTDGVQSRDEQDYSQAGDDADSEESDGLFSDDSDMPQRRSTRTRPKEVRPLGRMTRSHGQQEQKSKVSSLPSPDPLRARLLRLCFPLVSSQIRKASLAFVCAHKGGSSSFHDRSKSCALSLPISRATFHLGSLILHSG